MENEELILSEINDYLKALIATKEIGNIRYETLIPKTHQYDRYTIEDFLVIYKISRLAKHGIINNKLATLLRELYETKLEIIKQVGEELYRQLFSSDEEENENTILLKELNEKAQLIDITLDKYNLNPNKLELITIIDMLIKNEQYEKNFNEIEIIKLIKTL